MENISQYSTAAIHSKRIAFCQDFWLRCGFVIWSKTSNNISDVSTPREFIWRSSYLSHSLTTSRIVFDILKDNYSGKVWREGGTLVPNLKPNERVVWSAVAESKPHNIWPVATTGCRVWEKVYLINFGFEKTLPSCFWIGPKVSSRNRQFTKGFSSICPRDESRKHLIAWAHLLGRYFKRGGIYAPSGRPIYFKSNRRS